MAACFRTVTRFLECFMDFALVVLSLVAFIIAAVTLDQPSQFTDSYGQVVYYTLPSFWDTYSHTVWMLCVCAGYYAQYDAVCKSGLTSSSLPLQYMQCQSNLIVLWEFKSHIVALL